MKFSYTLLQRYLPGLRSKKALIEALSMHAFEAEDSGGKTIDATIPSNRYADAASHIGVAREAAAILRLKGVRMPRMEPLQKTRSRGARVSVKTSLCSRYVAREFTRVAVKQSPPWMRSALRECGLRPVNNVVDAMNIAMLETGQPLHAFDAEKIQGGIVVRTARKGEVIRTIDGAAYTLSPSVLVIADDEGPLGIAGIKGGARAAVTAHTTRVIVEAACFAPQNIYRTSKLLGLATDASVRFSHDLHPLLVDMGARRAAELLKETAGARAGGITDTSPCQPVWRRITFSPVAFKSLTGVVIKTAEALKDLRRLGFRVTGRPAQRGEPRWEAGNIVHVPPLRQDIETQADLAEEIVRLFGYGNVPSVSLTLSVGEHAIDEHFALADLVRDILIGFRFNEAYHYSFAPEGELELKNPIAEDKSHLRTTLREGLMKDVAENLRFSDEVRVFEVGKIFKGGERYAVGIAHGSSGKETFFAVKGVIQELLARLGLTDAFMRELPQDEGVEIVSYDRVIGKISKSFRAAYAELDMEELLKVVEWERSYEPLPKYPAAVRDMSLALPLGARIGNIMRAVEESNIRLIEDVDLIDEYDEGGRESITLRIVFRAEDRTLSSEEIDKEMKNITSLLEGKFNVKVR